MLGAVRLVASGIAALRRERITLGETSVVRARVVPGDLDVFGHVTNSRYLALLNVGRVDHLARTGLLQAAWRRRVPLLAARIDVRYLRPLRLRGGVELRTAVAHVDHRWVVYRTEVLQAGATCATALALTTFRGRDGGVAVDDLLPGVDLVRGTDEVRAWMSAARPTRLS